MADDADVLEVRVSRSLSLTAMAISAVWLAASIDIAFTHVILKITPSAGNRLAIEICTYLSLLLSATIFLTAIKRIIAPPCMLKVTAEGISFAAGRFYALRLIEWRHLRTAHVSVGPSTIASSDQPAGGLTIIFSPDSDIPTDCKTPSGMTYENYSLSINKRYMNTPPQEVVDYIRKHAPPPAPDAT